MTDNFITKIREICTELHDTGGHYVLSEEQFAAITQAYYQGIDEMLEYLGRTTDPSEPLSSQSSKEENSK